MSPPLLSLTGVCADIGHYHILHGVDLEVPEGGLTVLMGRNGAGKSTTLRTIMGLTTLTGGTVRFRGRDLAGQPTARIARQGIAYVPENMGIFNRLTVRENLLLAARRGRLDATRLAWVFVLFPPLEPLWGQAAGTLSGGQKQMLALGRALIEPRDLLLVDEPTKGLSPALVERLAQAFETLRQEQVTILLVEQNLVFAQRLGQSAVVMSDGRTVHRSTMTQLGQDEALQRKWLGLAGGNAP